MPVSWIALGGSVMSLLLQHLDIILDEPLEEVGWTHYILRRFVRACSFTSIHGCHNFIGEYVQTAIGHSPR